MWTKDKMNTKCTTCGVIINELLAFIQCKVASLDEVSIAQVFCDIFVDEEVDRAKDALFTHIIERRITRKDDHRQHKDILDIIKIMKETDEIERFRSSSAWQATDHHSTDAAYGDYYIILL